MEAGRVGPGYPTQARGVTSMPGVYVLGLPWLYTWGSGRFVGVGRDAGYLAERITDHLARRTASHGLELAITEN
jgi:putative flavoprotein involved in K+ transport